MTYLDIKALGKKLGRPAHTLLVLTEENDPFYADRNARKRDAEWFAEAWHRFSFGPGTHIRRIHYRLISQQTPIFLPNGRRYENTEICWKELECSSKDARYLGLVPIGHFIDQRNGDTKLHPCDPAEDAGLYFTTAPPTQMPEPPRLWLDRPTILQPYNIEIVVEKSTVDDVLLPLGERYKINVTSCAGDISLTRCFEIVRRAKADGRPTIILYISDFDPQGMGMPVAAARKIQFLTKDDDVEIQLRPIALSHGQCVEYELPRVPLKDTEKRTGVWEDRYGEGATELDALEALHPGALREILETEIERYLDTDIDDEIKAAAGDIEDEIDSVNAAVRQEYADEIQALQAEYAELDRRRERLYHRITESLDERAPDISDVDWPEPDDGDPDDDPLFCSSRDYVEQVDRFKSHQGKPTERRKKRRAAA